MFLHTVCLYIGILVGKNDEKIKKIEKNTCQTKIFLIQYNSSQNVYRLLAEDSVI